MSFEDLLEELSPGAAARGLDDLDAPRVPTSLGLTVRSVLGRGGLGWVFDAWDPAAERAVAVKVSRPDGGEAARDALLREGRTLARLRHPGILPLLSMVVEPTAVALVLPVAPSDTLAARLGDAVSEARPFPLEARLRTMTQVAGAVGAAHAQGVVHGDLHPGNVALGEDGAVQVLDWGAPQGDGFSGSPGYASPAQLRGATPTAACDVHALGALLFELILLRPLRARRHDEDLGRFLARIGAEPAPLPDGMPLRGLVEAALRGEIDAVGLADALRAHRSGAATAAARADSAEQLVARAWEGVAQLREYVERIAQEEKVLVVQRAKVPGHAPVEQKRPLWEAEERAEALRLERRRAWQDAADAAVRASELAEDDAAPREVLAELWWERMHAAETEGRRVDAALAAERVRRWDDGRYVRILDAPARLSLRCDVPGATAVLSRYDTTPRIYDLQEVRRVSLPVDTLQLPPGSWRVDVQAEGRTTTHLPVLLRRLQHHRADVRLFTPEEIGDGWCYVPAGPFKLGGDAGARQPLDPCEPTVGDRFITRTCVTSAEWLEFLDDLDPEEAARHVPGEAGLFAGFQAFWARGDDGRWRLPDGWNPRWPVFAVALDNAEAYAAWRSRREGRTVRLPTEEEWEKAARGVDGRVYPWGDGFDPTFAHMRQSRPGPPRPAEVAAYPVDTSPYGVRDMAGGLREWTASIYDEGSHVLRGGTYGDDADDLRVAGRAGLMPFIRWSFIGFRLITEGPRPTASRP